MGHFGFSYIGFLWLTLLFLPNLFWTKHKPEGYNPVGENWILLLFERIGEVLVTVCALIFSDLNIRRDAGWRQLLLIGSAVCMLLYEFWWIRYFRSEKKLTDFYRSLLGIPVAGATLPVFAFLLLGIYGRVIGLILAVVVLGIGHIGIHLMHRREIGRRDVPVNRK